jgi:hypothetical protein
MQNLLRCSGDAQRQLTSATTVPEKNGRWLSTDAACAETTEQLGSSCLAWCQDLGETLALAWHTLTLRPGGTVVMRPVTRTCQP